MRTGALTPATCSRPPASTRTRARPPAGAPWASDSVVVPGADDGDRRHATPATTAMMQRQLQRNRKDTGDRSGEIGFHILAAGHDAILALASIDCPRRFQLV